MNDQVPEKMSISRDTHCKRGPKNCKRCEAAHENVTIALVRVDGNENDEQRLITDFKLDDGTVIWSEFERVKVFETIDEARKYAIEHGTDANELDEWDE
jgi:hypothetical protein